MGIPPARRERALKRQTRKSGRKKSWAPEATAKMTTLESGYSAVWIIRVHSFIQIFTKHLLSAKYHIKHHVKHREEDDVTLPLEDKGQTTNKQIRCGLRGGEPQSRHKGSWGLMGRKGISERTAEA